MNRRLALATALLPAIAEAQARTVEIRPRPVAEVLAPLTSRVADDDLEALHTSGVLHFVAFVRRSDDIDVWRWSPRQSWARAAAVALSELPTFVDFSNGRDARDKWGDESGPRRRRLDEERWAEAIALADVPWTDGRSDTTMPEMLYGGLTGLGWCSHPCATASDLRQVEVGWAHLTRAVIVDPESPRAWLALGHLATQFQGARWTSETLPASLRGVTLEAGVTALRTAFALAARPSVDGGEEDDGTIRVQAARALDHLARLARWLDRLPPEALAVLDPSLQDVRRVLATVPGSVVEAAHERVQSHGDDCRLHPVTY